MTKYNRMVFWRASGCFKSPLAVLETLEDPNKGLTMKDNGKPIFIRSLENSKYEARPDDLLINWGNGGFNSFPKLATKNFKVLNEPNTVAIATNKIKTFIALQQKKVSHVPFFLYKAEAQLALDSGTTIIARTIIDGCCGQGIVVVEPGMKLPEAPLYTTYVKKMNEYRVHVFNGKVIDVVQKKLKKGLKSNGRIRNVDDGWSFSHEIKHIPEELHQLAIDAVKACGLDFGAVDIIWNKFYNKCYVLEINTAPGLEIKETIEAYAKAFLGVFNGKIKI